MNNRCWVIKDGVLCFLEADKGYHLAQSGVKCAVFWKSFLRISGASGETVEQHSAALHQRHPRVQSRPSWSLPRYKARGSKYWLESPRGGHRDVIDTNYCGGSGSVRGEKGAGTEGGSEQKSKWRVKNYSEYKERLLKRINEIIDWETVVRQRAHSLESFPELRGCVHPLYSIMPWSKRFSIV